MMADPLRRNMTADEFLVWNLSQDERYELVDGEPIPLRSMAGASNADDAIVINLIVRLGSLLDGSPCRPVSADTAVRTAIQKVRRPDVTIECSRVDPNSYEASNPVAVFEILSPSTRQLDRSVKLQEYMRHPGLRAIVHIDPGVMDVLVYTRGTDGLWEAVRLEQPDDQVMIPETPANVPLSVIYKGVPLQA